MITVKEIIEWLQTFPEDAEVQNALELRVVLDTYNHPTTIPVYITQHFGVEE